MDGAESGSASRARAAGSVPPRAHPAFPSPPPPAPPEQQQSSPLAATRPALVAAGPAGAVRRPGLSAQTPSCGVRPSLPGSETSPAGIHPSPSRPASRDRTDRCPEDKEAVPPPRRSPARESPPISGLRLSWTSPLRTIHSSFCSLPPFTVHVNVCSFSNAQ